MKIIPNNASFEQESIASIQNFFAKYSVGKALKKANAYKQKGFSALSIMQYAVQLVYMQLSMYRDSRNGDKSIIGSSSDAVYRLMKSTFVNWSVFIASVASKVCIWVNTLTSEDRLTALVLDDTLYHRPFSKKLELATRVFDHTDRTYKRGFRSLFLGWTDGATFIPMAFRHMSSTDSKQRYNESRRTDNRTCGAKAKKQAVMKAPDVALMMLRDAKKHGMPARHVLFDSWFTHPTFVMRIQDIGYHCIGRMKNSKTLYSHDCIMYTLKELYNMHKKRPGKSKYLLSIVVRIHNANGDSMISRIVFVRDRANRKKWIAFLCTDMSLSEEQIIELYGKRWSIEVFFKTCKTYLGFTGEFHQLSYEAITAHTSIVALRYMILSIEQRYNTDMRRTPGDLFFEFADEAKDIKFNEVMAVLINELTKFICGLTMLDEKAVIILMDEFFQTLPAYIKCFAKLQNAS